MYFNHRKKTQTNPTLKMPILSSQYRFSEKRMYKMKLEKILTPKFKKNINVPVGQYLNHTGSSLQPTILYLACLKLIVNVNPQNSCASTYEHALPTVAHLWALGYG